jgi:hypothetical protein
VPRGAGEEEEAAEGGGSVMRRRSGVIKSAPKKPKGFLGLRGCTCCDCAGDHKRERQRERVKVVIDDDVVYWYSIQ